MQNIILICVVEILIGMINVNISFNVVAESD